MSGTKKMGIIVTAFFGFILLSSTVLIAIPGIIPSGSQMPDPEQVTITGTPMDNFPDAQRPQFCGQSEPKSTAYIVEYGMPQLCSQPMALAVAPDGGVWVAGSNTGNLARFDPVMQEFTEYENVQWPEGAQSQIWGMDYADGSIWYTDAANRAIWKYDTGSGVYQQLDLSEFDVSLPQILKVVGDDIIITDLLGNSMVVLDQNLLLSKTTPSDIPGSVTSGFGTSGDGSIWYVNWLTDGGGILVNIHPDLIKGLDFLLHEASRSGGELEGLSDFISDLELLLNEADKSSEDVEELSASVGELELLLGEASQSGGVLDALSDFISDLELLPLETVQLPLHIAAPNGVAVDHAGNVWITDTGSSHFYMYDAVSGNFTQYTTSDPNVLTYGNFTGVTKSPITRPYWAEVNDMGNVVFNEQTGNRMAVMHPGMEKLVEYDIPSRNPHWSDCNQIPICGIAQALVFTVDGTDVWFSEWVENSIGHLDTTRPLLFDVRLPAGEVYLAPGQVMTVSYELVSLSDRPVSVTPITAYTHAFLVSSQPSSIQLLDDAGDTWEGTITVSAGPDAEAGAYKILVGGEGGSVSVSRYVTVYIEP